MRIRFGPQDGAQRRSSDKDRGYEPVRTLGGNKILGLAIGERSMVACELVRAGRNTQATRLAEFEFPAGVSADNPAALGKALGQFLQEKRFSVRRATIGLPLRWAVVKQKEVPPADPSVVAGLLLLQAETEFALEPQDLVFEYAGQSDPAASRTVLLLAVQRRRVDAVVAMAEAAGLTVDAVTLSTVALAAETARRLDHGGAVLHVAPGFAELAIHHGGQPRVLRHLRSPSGIVAGSSGPTARALDATSALGEMTAAGGASGAMASPDLASRAQDAVVAFTPELRQVLSLVPQNGTAAPTEMVVWDGLGLGDAPRRWADTLHVAVREQSLDSLGITLAPDANADDDATAGGGRFAAAVSLALEGLRGSVSTDLLHSRLVPPKSARVGRRSVWAAVLGVTFAAAIVFALFDLSAARSDVADMKTRLKDLQPQIAEATASIERTTFALRWTSTEPQSLALLRDVTMAFPEGGGVWATSLSLAPDGRVTLSGRATSDEAPLTLLKRLRDSKTFIDVQLGGTQPAGRGSSEVAFTINFRYPGVSQ